MKFIYFLLCLYNFYLFIIEVSTFVHYLLSFLICIFTLFYFCLVISIAMGHGMGGLSVGVGVVFVLIFVLGLCGISGGLTSTVASFSLSTTFSFPTPK